MAAGFAPGSFNRDSGEYRVRDLDAHSWVEVYFNGIGWVTFDPTPAAAPAEPQAADLSDERGHRRGDQRLARPAPPRPTARATAPARPRRSPAAAPRRGCCSRCSCSAAAACSPGTWSSVAGGWPPEELAEAQLAELRRALARLDWDVPAGTTLLGLERRLGRDGRAGRGPLRAPACARTATTRARAAGARPCATAARCAVISPPAPGCAAACLGLIAIPPGGPRPA